MELTATNIAIICLALVALASTVGMAVNRNKGAGKGIGESINQFAIATVVLPIIAILAIAGVLSLEVTGTLLGAAIGFVANGRQNRIAK
ncbi:MULTISPECIES: hypothetical protein [Kordiimonas]|jgi:xanthine/uracil permease|uniref:hypothetical protein n=1 Tax=Kordiimonas TaxID=288021 RepID=UPI00257B15B0|nr:hypothetical protein [Kordiimonas sp. UBA4487]